MESTLRKRTKKSMKIGLTFGETVLLRDSSTMWNKLKKFFDNLPDKYANLLFGYSDEVGNTGNRVFVSERYKSNSL